MEQIEVMDEQGNVIGYLEDDFTDCFLDEPADWIGDPFVW